MVVSEGTKNLNQLLANVQSQLTRNVNYIPVAQWGFDESALEVLNKRKHKAVDKQLTKGTGFKEDKSFGIEERFQNFRTIL